jgi:hypothetical protein
MVGMRRHVLSQFQPPDTLRLMMGSLFNQT